MEIVHEIVIELPKDIDKLCRTCMNFVEDEEKKCVTNTDDKSDNLELNNKLFFLTGSTITSNECLPKFMCSDCVEKLEISYYFKKLCQNTYLNFRNFMDSSETETDTKKDSSEFVCSICSLSFKTLYSHSKHQIEHRNDNLFIKYRNEEKESGKNLVNNIASDKEIALLIADRKQQTTEDHNYITIEPINNSNIHNIEEEIDIKLNLESVDDTKPTICDICSRELNSNMSLQLHFINHAILAESETDPEILDQYFFCRKCGETFNTSEEMQAHIIKCSPENKEFNCTKCKQKFISELLLLRHEKDVLHSDYYLGIDDSTIPVEGTVYICPICNEEFTGRGNLYLHSVRHVLKKITCRICKRTFSCQVAHNNHLKTHPKYKHMCNLCGKWLGSRHALKTHIMGVHSATKDFVCSVCSKAFKTPSRLYIHKLTHNEDKKFICSVCNYKTNYVGDFKVHTRIHTSERPYKCNFVNCNRQFKTSSHLNEHLQRHLQIKKYQCNMCCMVFGHNHTLKMHLMVHTGEKPFTCQICKVKFRRKHHLKNHMKQHGKVDTEKTTNIVNDT